MNYFAYKYKKRFGQLTKLKMQKLITSLTLTFSVATAVAYPGDDCCTLYAEDYFEGESAKFCFNEARAIRGKNDFF